MASGKWPATRTNSVANLRESIGQCYAKTEFFEERQFPEGQLEDPYSLLGLARAPQGATRFRAGVLTVSKDLYTVDKNMFDADGILLGLLVAGHIGNRVRIKDDDIGKHTRFQETAMIQSKIRRRKTR